MPTVHVHTYSVNCTVQYSIQYTCTARTLTWSRIVRTVHSTVQYTVRTVQCTVQYTTYSTVHHVNRLTDCTLHDDPPPSLFCWPYTVSTLVPIRA